LNPGNTYGFANCGQAVQAGIIGIAILLFVGGIFMVSFSKHEKERKTL
jgi:hypothetical protein